MSRAPIVVMGTPTIPDDFVPKQSTCSSAEFLVLGMLLTVQVKVSADCLDVKTHHACSHDNHVLLYMKGETSISCDATIVWCLAFLG
jgi:hypothetical protein